MENFFDVIKCIDSKSAYELDEVMDVYNPFMINRGFSQAANTVFFANEMNKYYNLDKKLQFDFYFNGIPKSKQYRPWAKGESDKNVKLVQAAYGVSRQKAETYLKLLTEDQINSIATEMNPGGRK